ncbi:hypothetical protein MXB_908 [Myxobolus squamalis]|nr:hypothetical protein MXB_908 [Myxobolus squamalis]
MKLLFSVRFFDPQPNEMEDTFARHYIYLQCLYLIMIKSYKLPPELQIVLYPYILQINYGNYSDVLLEQLKEDFPDPKQAERVIRQYKLLNGQSAEQSELFALIIFSKYPLFNMQVYSANLKGTPFFVGLNHAGISILTNTKNIKYTIPWMILQEIRAIKDVCIISFLNVYASNLTDLAYFSPAVEELIKNIDTDKTNAKYIDVGLKFEKSTIASDFLSDCIKMHTFYSDYSKRKHNFKKFLPRNNKIDFKNIRNTNISPTKNSVHVRFSVRQIRMLRDSPLPKYYILNNIDDFEMIFKVIPLKNDDKENINNLIDKPSLDIMEKKNEITDVKILTDNDTINCNHDIMNDKPFDLSLNEQEFNLQLLSNSEISNEEDAITFNEEIEQAIKETDSFFDSPDL